MEELLQDIFKEASGPKLASLRKACQDATEILSGQDNGARSPACEVRRACLLPLQIALESKRPKLVTFALNGFHKLLRDDRFHRGIEPEDDSLWIPSQLLCATASVMYHLPDTQVQIFRMYLSLALSPRRTLNGRLVVWMCGRCGEAAAAPAHVAAAARAAAAQTLRAYCAQLDEEYEEVMSEGSPLSRNHLLAVGCYSEVIPVVQYLCGRLSETQLTTKPNPMALFFLDCLLTLVASLPERVAANTHFTTFLWQKFCPALISFLGTPRQDKNIKAREHEGHLVDDSGRGSGALACAPSFNGRQAKAVYSIAGQLVRLVGCTATLRPVLEALYHRMLLYPPAAHRVEPLRSARELLQSPQRLYRLILLRKNDQGYGTHSDDMAIIRLIMDSVEECARSGVPEAVVASVECATGLLDALQRMCAGTTVPAAAAAALLRHWPALHDADYTGPLTYQSLARLPSPYRDVVAGLQSAEEKDVDTSDTSGPENNSPGSSEPESDADDVFLPSRAPRRSPARAAPAAAPHPAPHPAPPRAPRTLNLGRCADAECNVDLERHNARQFVKTIQGALLPKLFSLRTGIEVDEAMQEFASKCCQHNAAQPPTTATIMNADGIYLATYSALLLNLKLIRLNYYKDSSDLKLSVCSFSEKVFMEGVHGSEMLVYCSATWLRKLYQPVLATDLLRYARSADGPQVALVQLLTGRLYDLQVSVWPLSEEAFVEEVQGSGVLVYLSATWLRELYQQVLATDLLRYSPSADGQHVALVHLLTDLGGLEQSSVMSDWQRLKEVSMPQDSSACTPEHQASLRWARRIMTCVWDSLVAVLSTPLAGGAARHQLRGLLRKRLHGLGKRKRLAWDQLTILCLEGLHKAARVSNTLGLQNRCSSILALLANSAVSQPPNGKIISTHALSLDILITGGLELGSKAPECWEHIFAGCQYVARIEHALFGQQGAAASVALPAGRLSHDTAGRDDETCVDVFNFLQPSLDDSSNDMSVAKIVESCRQEKGSLGAEVLTGASAVRVCCALAAAADTLFTRIASTTTLPALRAALLHLTQASHRLLFSNGWGASEGEARWWRRGGGAGGGGGGGAGGGGAADAARALGRAGDVTLRCLRAARPLAHRMAVWTIVGPHFMQAACHKDIHISSLAVQCMYDSIAALLSRQAELPHFHFNEALLKPYENLLCLELCDTDVQEQIISCICEFVETNRMEIRSGWRPLFNTLRAANNSNQYSAILEIFKVFLGTDNTLVFANAALDCILCLLSHIKGLHYEETQHIEPANKKVFQNSTHFKSNFSTRLVKYNNKFIPINEEKSERIIIDMCKESLYHLESCADILTMMYNMPKCPIFNTGNRIKGDIQLSVVDPIIPSGVLDITKFISNEDCNEEIISYKKLSTTLPSNYTTGSCLLKLDKPSNILKVWYALIEGLISATVVCSKNNQPAAMETLFKLFRNIIDVPGTHFGLHCINHLLLPTVQNWLRQIANVNTCWDSVMPNFKQCCGMTTDTIVLYLHHLQQLNVERCKADDKPDVTVEPIENSEATFALKQIMLILVECIAQPQEPIARLGASCIRHIILTSGHLLTDNQWEIVCTSLHRACNVSLTPLKQLSFAFKENSNSFYGDLAIVKVAARRDCSVNDNVRLHAMAQQVFLNDQLRSEQSLKNQSKANNKTGVQSMLIDDRSYIFLVYLQETLNTLNPDLFMVRIPHRGLVVGLLAHQILVQIIATVLIQASSDVFNGINNILLDSLKTGSTVSHYKFFLNNNNADLLLKSLELSYSRGMQFDSRPGLKFLIQKVSNLDFAANLYKQTTSSWLIKIISLTEYFFGGVERFKLKPTDLIIILNSFTANLNLTLEYDRFILKIFDMKSTWELLCNSYVSHLASNTVFDNLENPKTEVMSSCSSGDDTDVSMPAVVNNTQHEITMENITEEIHPDKSDYTRPFTFADFKSNARRYSTGQDIEDVVVEKIGKNDTDIDIELADESNKAKDIIERKRDISPVRQKGNSLGEDNRDRTRKVNITICDGPTYKNGESIKKSVEPLIPPQPVPPEIEQQRIHSIAKDAETRRGCFQNILMAYLELVLTFPLERFEVVYPVLQDGFLQLSQVASDPQVLDRVNAFFNRKDMV